THSSGPGRARWQSSAARPSSATVHALRAFARWPGPSPAPGPDAAPPPVSTARWGAGQAMARGYSAFEPPAPPDIVSACGLLALTRPRTLLAASPAGYEGAVFKGMQTVVLGVSARRAARCGAGLLALALGACG